MWQGSTPISRSNKKSLCHIQTQGFFIAERSRGEQHSPAGPVSDYSFTNSAFRFFSSFSKRSLSLL